MRLIVLQLWLIVECTKLIMAVFATSGKSSAGTILPLELYPTLSTYNTEFLTLAVQRTWSNGECLLQWFSTWGSRLPWE